MSEEKLVVLRKPNTSHGLILEPGIKRPYTNKLNSSKWWEHRSTWMGVMLIISAIILILAFTVASPAIEIILAVFGGLILIPMNIGLCKGIFDAFDWLFEYDNYFHHFIDWAKNNKAQVFIAGVGISLSLIGIGLCIGFAPILGPLLIATCGCSVAIFAVYLVAYGPVTIADAINRLLDRHQAQQALDRLESDNQKIVSADTTPQVRDPSYNPVFRGNNPLGDDVLPKIDLRDNNIAKSKRIHVTPKIDLINIEEPKNDICNS